MKKSKGDQFLCDDIIAFGILLRLPAKALSRLKCVCKKWNSLISGDQVFICLQSQNLSAASSLLFMQAKEEMVIVSRDPRSIGIPKFSHQNESWRSILASCNGLLCILFYGREPKLYVGNPVLNDWRLIPYLHHEPFEAEAYGLAVELEDSVVCYKLVRPYIPKESYNNTNDTVECNYKVFSSDTGMWKVSKEKIILPMPSMEQLLERPAYVRKTLYWMFADYVMWFCPKEERGGHQPLPSDITSSTNIMTRVRSRIGEWNGMLSYTVMIGPEIQIWSMNQSCWSKSYSVKLEKIVEDNMDIFTSVCHRMSLRNRKPLDIINRGYTMTLMPFQGDAMFFQIGRIMFWYDMVTGEAGKHKITSSHLLGYWCMYKNCLLSSPSPKA